MYRGIPPSAGACQTTDAALNPDCGRASRRSSIMTAIGRRAATSGGTNRPVSGAGTRTGVGLGLGVGVGVGLGSTLGFGLGSVASVGAPDRAAAWSLGPAEPPVPAAPPTRIASTTTATRLSMATPATSGRLIYQPPGLVLVVRVARPTPRTRPWCRRRIHDRANPVEGPGVTRSARRPDRACQPALRNRTCGRSRHEGSSPESHQAVLTVLHEARVITVYRC